MSYLPYPILLNITRNRNPRYDNETPDDYYKRIAALVEYQEARHSAQEDNNIANQRVNNRSKRLARAKERYVR